MYAASSPRSALVVRHASYGRGGTTASLIHTSVNATCNRRTGIIRGSASCRTLYIYGKVPHVLHRLDIRNPAVGVTMHQPLPHAHGSSNLPPVAHTDVVATSTMKLHQWSDEVGKAYSFARLRSSRVALWFLRVARVKLARARPLIGGAWSLRGASQA